MNPRIVRPLVLGLFFVLLLPVPASAQRKLWGVTVSFAPIWQSAPYSKYLEGAEEVNMEGQSFRIGVSRGGPVQGDWSLLLVRRSFEKGGTIDKDGLYTTNGDVTITGFEAEGFIVSGNIKDRVLLGVVIAGGVGVVQGTMVDANGQTVDAKNVLTLFNTDVKIQPLVRLEFGVGFVVAKGFRIRVSGGFDWPGWSTSIGATYFFGDR